MLLLTTLACTSTSVPLGKDGGVDDTGPAMDTGDTATAATYAGTGADGPLEVDGTFDLTALAPSWPVTGMDGDTVGVDGAVEGLAAGDEVLLVNLHGSDDAFAEVGRYAFARVASVVGASVRLADPPAAFAIADQAVVLVRVPNFTDVTVRGRLTTAPWDGRTGGVVAFRASGTVAVVAGGSVSADALGYAGGVAGGASNADGYQGESYAGEGDGGVNGAPYNERYGYWAANHGGGGANVSGGGGEYGGGATPGDAWYPGGKYTAPEAGETYGDAALSTLFFGSGGGGVWDDGLFPDPGGSGGGIVFVAAQTIEAGDVAAFTARGGSTEAWAHGTWSYGAGGGAGGTIWLVGDTMTLGADAVDARGGYGMRDVDSWGGDGGMGRVRVDATLVVGASVAEATEPDAYTP